jgi:hypothetical protein
MTEINKTIVPKSHAKNHFQFFEKKRIPNEKNKKFCFNRLAISTASRNTIPKPLILPSGKTLPIFISRNIKIHAIVRSNVAGMNRNV